LDQKEQQVIDALFGKLQQLDRQSRQRDAEAEAHIGRQVANLPAAPYYMAQAILVQEQALGTLQSRVQELEQQLAQRAAGGGSFLGALFGAGSTATQPAAPQRTVAPAAQGPIPQQYLQPGMAAAGSPWGRPSMGGGFLAGALQTAVGVAGGMLVADALSHAFSAGTSEVSELAHDAGWGAAPVEPAPVVQDASWDEPRAAPDPSADFDTGIDDGGDDGSFDV
jgi:hypothetical protein